MTARDATGEAARVLAANERFYAAFNAHDIEAMSDCWSRSAELTCVHPGWSALVGHEAVMASWRAILENSEQPRIVAGAARATVLGDVATVLCHELVSGSPLAATNLFVLEDGEWRLIHHHSSPVQFLAEQAADERA